MDLDTSTRGVNRVMYQRDLQIQKGLKNKVRIQFKNSDQKKIRIYSTQTYVFSMFDSVNQRLILEKPLTVIDDASTATRGLAELTLTESDTIDLTRSSYAFSVKLLDSDGSYVPTYSNTYYGVSGTLHIQEDIYARAQPSLEVKSFTKTYNPSISKYQHSSGNIYANPEYNGNSGLHTIAVYTQNYRGTIKVEATLENSPGAGDHYALLLEKHYNNVSGIDFLKFNGVYSYIRVTHIPDQGPGDLDNDNPAYFGTFDKILYRS